jgi:hypothetical protein
MMKTLMVAATLTFAPIAATAQQLDDCERETTAATCAYGMVWSEEKSACVPITS